MTTYTPIANSDIDQDSPVTSGLMAALRDNPLAIGEGASGAPINQAFWHPYDSALVGDGNDGEFYDFATDGSSTAMETPTLTAGYDYAIRIEALSMAGGTDPFSLDVYAETSAAWLTVATTAAVPAPNQFYGMLGINAPMLSWYGWSAYEVLASIDATDGANAVTFTPQGSTTQQRVTKLRISAVGGTDSGKLFLYRRRSLLGEY